VITVEAVGFVLRVAEFLDGQMLSLEFLGGGLALLLVFHCSGICMRLGFIVVVSSFHDHCHIITL
jgi:hypothetical protein